MSSQPAYPSDKLALITVPRIKRIHAVSVQYGKTSSVGIRDEGALDRLANTIQRMAKGHADGPSIAAAAIESVVKDHPFWDGNHRTAFELGRLICILFGYRLDVTAEEAVTFMRLIDSHDLPTGDIRRWVRERIVPMKEP